MNTFSASPETTVMGVDGGSAWILPFEAVDPLSAWRSALANSMQLAAPLRFRLISSIAAFRLGAILDLTSSGKSAVSLSPSSSRCCVMSLRFKPPISPITFLSSLFEYSGTTLSKNSSDLAAACSCCPVLIKAAPSLIALASGII